jgi:hypothetical protein
LLRLQNAFIHGPRSNNKTIGKGSIPPKATMDVVQENYKGSNPQFSIHKRRKMRSNHEMVQCFYNFEP